MDFPKLQPELWRDLAPNPIIASVREQDSPGDAYGDPQVLMPGDFDGQWHIFFHGFTANDGQWFHHMVSKDGVHFALQQKWQNEMGQSFILKHGDEFIFYSSCYLGGASHRVEIKAFTTKDLVHFSEPVALVAPEYGWELEGCYQQVRNPCVVRLPNGRYRLYYSGGVVFLDDLGYEEPKYISYAESDSPYGPFVKHGAPILSPDQDISYRNLGAGAIKVFGYEDGYLGLYNGIYADAQGRSASAIGVLCSADGIHWAEAPYNPIIAPTGGWRMSMVYQLDLVTVNGTLYMYYNARDGFKGGIEKIGLSVIDYDGPKIRRLNH